MASLNSCIIHLALNKMDTVSQTILSNAFFLNEDFCIWIKISLRFIPGGLIDNKSALGLDETTLLSMA